LRPIDRVQLLAKFFLRARSLARASAE
jgi:hypothetical protein